MPKFDSPDCVEDLNSIVGLISGGTCQPDILLAEVKKVLFQFSLLDCGCNRIKTARGRKAKENQQLVEQVWAEFWTNLEQLKITAVFLFTTLKERHAETKADNKYIAISYEALEGEKFLEQHQRPERDKRLVDIKKFEVQKEFGMLRCEVCQFSFKKFYGNLGEDFIECHHTTPLSTLSEQHHTQLKDLALVCANRHRMLHRGMKVLTIAILQRLIVETCAGQTG